MTNTAGIADLDLATAARLLTALAARFPNKGGDFGFCKPGRRFVRIAHGRPSSLAVVCFVERATGRVFSAKSWKAPLRATGETVWQVAS